MAITEQLNIFKQGNNEALKEIFVSCKSGLYFVAYNYLKDDEKARDVVQNVFLKLLQMNAISRNKFLPDNGEELKRLLHVITKNKAIDELRKSNTRILALKNYSFFSNKQTNTNEYFINDIFSLILSKLPKREGEILKLHIEGYKNEEIAQNLQISYNTVRNTLSEGKKKAQSYWEFFN